MFDCVAVCVAVQTVHKSRVECVAVCVAECVAVCVAVQTAHKSRVECVAVCVAVQTAHKSRDESFNRTSFYIWSKGTKCLVKENKCFSKGNKY